MALQQLKAEDERRLQQLEQLAKQHQQPPVAPPVRRSLSLVTVAADNFLFQPLTSDMQSSPSLVQPKAPPGAKAQVFPAHFSDSFPQ
jgi:hypothetical protein